jgi:hypothetical protein
MGGKIMTDAQFQAIIDLVIAILKRSTSEEAIAELQIVRKSFESRKQRGESKDNN